MHNIHSISSYFLLKTLSCYKFGSPLNSVKSQPFHISTTVSLFYHFFYICLFRSASTFVSMYSPFKYIFHKLIMPKSLSKWPNIFPLLSLIVFNRIILFPLLGLIYLRYLSFLSSWLSRIFSMSTFTWFPTSSCLVHWCSMFYRYNIIVRSTHNIW